MVRKGYERVMCERWVGDWTKTATYWPPSLLAIAALLSHPAGLTASNYNHWLQTLISNSLELPVAPGYIIVWRPPASESVASALNSTRPQSRLSPLISSTGCTCYLHWCTSYLTARPSRRSICYTRALENGKYLFIAITHSISIE